MILPHMLDCRVICTLYISLSNLPLEYFWKSDRPLRSRCDSRGQDPNIRHKRVMQRKVRRLDIPTKSALLSFFLLSLGGSLAIKVQSYLNVPLGFLH
jgi:hypothetical protein